MVALLTIKPESKKPYASKVRLYFDSLEYFTIDYRIQFGRTAQADPEIVLLAIDEPSINLSGVSEETIAASKTLSLIKSNRYPFPREVYSDICDRLFSAGARVVAFDLILQSPSPFDQPFQKAIDKYQDKIVIGLEINENSTVFNLPPASLLTTEDPFDNRLGFLNFWSDSDNIIRCAQYRTNMDYLSQHVGAENLPKFYSLAARVAQKAGYANLVPNDFKARPLRFAGPSRFSKCSLYEIFDPRLWEKNFHNGDFIKNKIVLVGPYGNWSKDELLTPWGRMFGAEIHLNAINSLIHSEFLYPASDALVIAITIGSGLLELLLAMTISQIAWRFAVGLVFIAAYTASLLWTYNAMGWLLPSVAPTIVFFGAGAVGYIFDFVLTQVEKLRLRTTFERYNSKNVVRYLLDHTASYKEMLAGTRRSVTVLFSDIRGFTTIVETTTDSHQLVNKLNEYFTAMVACVFKYDGSLDKFMGDGIMAVWGNTPYNFGPKGDAVRAVKAALAMLVELRRLNAKWRAEGKSEWHIGIGLNHGPVIVGDMGSQQHKEFAVVGDAVNLGSRLESLTKEYYLQILIGERLAELVEDEFHLRSVDIVQVKGKTQAVKAFTVLGEKSEPLTPERQKFLHLYEEGISSFRRREFERARDLFQQALQIQGDDYLCAQYRATCDDFLTNPPDKAWTGVRVMTKK